MRWIKFLIFLFPFSAVALTSPVNVDEPIFDFSTIVPIAPKPIRYDVIFDAPNQPQMVERPEQNLETEEKETVVFEQETLSFSPKQLNLSEQAEKTIQNLSDHLKKEKQARIVITLFFYQGTGFETAESKRLALKRSLSIKSELKKYEIDSARVFIQIKQTVSAHTSHIAQVVIKSR